MNAEPMLWMPPPSSARLPTMSVPPIVSSGRGSLASSRRLSMPPPRDARLSRIVESRTVRSPRLRIPPPSPPPPARLSRTVESRRVSSPRLRIPPPPRSPPELGARPSRMRRCLIVAVALGWTRNTRRMPCPVTVGASPTPRIVMSFETTTSPRHTPRTRSRSPSFAAAAIDLSDPPFVPWSTLRTRHGEAAPVTRGGTKSVRPIATINRSARRRMRRSYSSIDRWRTRADGPVPDIHPDRCRDHPTSWCAPAAETFGNTGTSAS